MSVRRVGGSGKTAQALELDNALRLLMLFKFSKVYNKARQVRTLRVLDVLQLALYGFAAKNYP